MKIYTKTGDTGKTYLLGNKVSKSETEIKLVGSIDEAQAFISFAQNKIIDKKIDEILDKVIYNLYVIASEVAYTKEFKINEEDVTELEGLIDSYNENLAPLTKFIYFKKHESASILNIARTVVRRAERYLVIVKDNNNPYSLKYVNRLSDLLFTLTRCINEN